MRRRIRRQSNSCARSPPGTEKIATSIRGVMTIRRGISGQQQQNGQCSDPQEICEPREAVTVRCQPRASIPASEPTSDPATEPAPSVLDLAPDGSPLDNAFPLELSAPGAGRWLS